MILGTVLLATTLASGGYATVEQASWEEVRVDGVRQGNAQLSVHIPLNLVAVSDLFYADCAFNAWKLAIPPNLKTGDAETSKIIQSLKTTVVSFAFGEAPFVADYHQTLWTREPGGYPIVTGELDATYRHYTLSYCTNPENGELYIRGTVKNTGENAGKAVIRVRRAQPKELDIADYHYIGFRWTAAKWATGGIAEPPQVIASDFDSSEVENGWKYPESAYGRGPGFWGSPYNAAPEMRLLTSTETVRKFEAFLQPGEERSFTISAGFGEKPMVSAPSFAETVQKSKAYWDKFLVTQADFGNARDNDIFRCLQFGDLQLLVNPWKTPNPTQLQPCQGGSSERFYVWVWEAMCQLRPMVRLGHFNEVRKVLEFILSLQDAGVPPEGDFTTTAGAIGTTGPRWANTTGAALLLASDYLALSGDEAFAKDHLEGLVRAAQWIVHEAKATRKLNPDGTKVVGYGLFPGCVADDGNRGIFFATTDVWSCKGAERFVEALKARGDARAEEIGADARLYRQAIEDTEAQVQRADGFIPSRVGDVGKGSFEFRNVPESLDFYCAEFADPVKDLRMKKMEDYWEAHGVDGLFVDPFDAHIIYVGNCEECLANANMQRGEWKKAYLLRQTFMNYAMTPDLYVTSERYSVVDPTFTPWQPNGSGDGRGLDLMADRFLLEGSSRLVLLGGFAPWEAKSDLSISNLFTNNGRFSLEKKGGHLTVRWERPLAVGTQILIPGYFHFKPTGTALASCGKELWEVKSPLVEVAGEVE